MKNQPNLLIAIVIMMFVVLGCFGPDGRGSGEEGTAIASLRTLHGAQATYISSTGEGNYATSFDTLVNQQLIDSKFKGVQPEKYGYRFSMRVTPKIGADGKAKFSVNADPISVGVLDSFKRYLAGEKDPQIKRYFYIDESGCIRFSKGRPATVKDESLVNCSD